MRFWREPLLHFLLAGAALFAVYEIAAPGAAAEDSRVIRVQREDLLTFMQFRAQAFQPELFEARLDALPPAQLQSLVEDYVREEALFREASAMGMSEGDYIIRQRLVQKLDFLLQDLASAKAEPAPGELERFFQERRADYQVDSVYTFTHIFFDKDKHGEEGAQARARELLAESAALGFSDAPAHGDHYPFLTDYVERTRDYVINNFGAGFVEALDALAPGENWQGPLASPYGYHLVLMRERREPFIPPLKDIEARVLEDFRYERRVRRREEAVAEIVSGYEVQLELE